MADAVLQARTTRLAPSANSRAQALRVRSTTSSPGRPP